MNVEVIRSDHHDISPPLGELAAASTAGPVVQRSIGAGEISTPLVTFEGMGSGLPGFTVQAARPDPSGDIGPNHYVQIVEAHFTVFNRTGGVVSGPITINQLFAGFSGACQNTNDGNGLVRYDRYADRWIITQFSVNGGNGPFFQCIAVSTTGNPAGSYARYQFSFNAFNDDAKFGLWPDGYYITFDMFIPPQLNFGGAKACAFDRAKMLLGQPASMQCFDTSNQIGGLRPSDVDGPTLPPVGSPNYLLALNDNTSMVAFRFHVDFATPANSTFTGPTIVPVVPFTPLCNGGACVVQPATTVRLDSLGDRLMNRLVYRNFGTHEALLVSHAVTAGAGGGVRFYEVRSPGTTPTVFQQGTYAPDAAFRWISSMAFDGDGNIGMGFSISSSTIRPSVRYTGRLVGDPLGTMGQGEETIVNGTGSQLSSSQWGSYSALNIDPTDDCTFWYTQEYMAVNGSFNWRTRIGTFRFPTCDAPPNDFRVTPNPTSRTATAGATATYAVNTAVVTGSAQTVTLSVSGLPPGVTGSFNPPSVTAGGSSTLSLAVAATASSGTTQFTITGTGTSTTRTANASLTVNQAPVVSILSPANNSTVGGLVTVSASASDVDGTVTSVKFDLPDGTSITDTSAPFSTLWNSETVSDNPGYTIRATATDDRGATAASLVSVTVSNAGSGCIDNQFNGAGGPQVIPDNDPLGITSTIQVVGNGKIASLSLSVNIAHPFRGDLAMQLISPDGARFSIASRQGGAEDGVLYTNQPVMAVAGVVASGTWQLEVQDLAIAHAGSLASWSMAIVGDCSQLRTDTPPARTRSAP